MLDSPEGMMHEALTKGIDVVVRHVECLRYTPYLDRKRRTRKSQYQATTFGNGGSLKRLGTCSIRFALGIA